MFALGALQGAIGWYMVASGLADRIDVSQYRLALHLLTAFAILGLLVWLARDVGPQRSAERRSRWRAALGCRAVRARLCAVGARRVVAGLKAGLTYNTWPLWTAARPDGLRDAVALSSFRNVTTAQFNHRLIAYPLVIARAAHAVGRRARASDARVRIGRSSLGGRSWRRWGSACGRCWAVPFPLGLAHQAGGALVVASEVCTCMQQRAPPSATEPDARPRPRDPASAQVLHGRAGGALAEVVEPRNQQA